MIDLFQFNHILGDIRFLVWSKENEIHRMFFRTMIAGHWDKTDVEEYLKCGCYYEFHFDHKYDEEAQLFCMMVMQRCENFKAARVCKLAVNNMKVFVLLGRSAEYKNGLATLAKQSGFELARLRSKEDVVSENEKFTRTKVGQYFESLKKAFAPMAGIRYERRD